MPIYFEIGRIDHNHRFSYEGYRRKGFAGY
jgi:hypothetical protein